MKKNIQILQLLILIVFIPCFFCSHTFAQSDPIRVGITHTQPKEYLDENGKPAGFFPELLNHIAEKEGWTLEYVLSTWDDCLNKIENGELELVADATYSAARADRFDFNEEVVLETWSRVYAGNNISIDSILDLDKKKVTVLKGSIQAEILRADAKIYNILPEFIEVESYTTVFYLVESGIADACIVDRLFGLQHMKNFGINETGVIFGPSRLGFISTKGKNRDILSRIDINIALMKKNPESIYYREKNKVLALAKKSAARIFPFNSKEVAWLAAHPVITIAVSNDWPPMSYDDQGKPNGINVDIIKALNIRLNGALKIIPLPREKRYEGVKAKQIDALMDITPRPDRDPYFNFTTPYIVVPHIIFARKDSPYYGEISDLDGKAVGLERAVFIIDVLRKRYPNIRIKEFDTTSDSLDAVSKGVVDAYIGNRSVGMYIIDHELMTNIKGHGKIEETASVNTIGVRKDWPILHSIMQKALDDLRRDELRAILKKWIDAESKEPAVNLTSEEKAWLALHPKIKVSNQLDWPPYDFFEDGKPQGFAIDFLSILSEKIGVEFEFVTGTWPDLMDQFKQKKIDIIHPLRYTESRLEYMNYTEPILTLYYVLALRKSEEPIDTLKQLHGKTLATGEGWTITDYVRKNHPRIKLYVVEDSLEGLWAVRRGQADAWIDNYATTKRLIEKHFMPTLKISGKIKDLGVLHFPNHHIGVRKDWPILRDIFQKVMNDMTQKDRARLARKWNIYSGSVPRIPLSNEELNWLIENPVIRLGYDTEHPPVEYMDKEGRFIGISADFMKLIGDMIGVKIQPVDPQSWQETIKAVKSGSIDILPAVAFTPKLNEFLNFSEPYLRFPLVIVTNNEVSYIGDMRELAGRKIAVLDGHASHEILTSQQHDLLLLPKQSVGEGLRAVLKGEAHAFIDNSATIAHVISRDGITGLKVSGETPYGYDFAIGVRKDQPILFNLMQKALKAISEEEKNAIYKQWISISYEHGFDYGLMWKLIIGAALIILAILYWNRRLTHEIDLRQTAQVDLKHAKDMAESANRVKSAFLASMSHELRTPLNSIIGFNSIILDEMAGPLNFEQKKQLKMVKGSASHLLNLINDVLDISKIEAGELEISYDSFSIRDVINDVFETLIPMAEKKGLSFSVDIATGLDLIYNDERRIRQVLINLANNAIKFTETGEVKIICMARDNFVEFQVRDTGIGIKKEDINKLFQPFHQLEIGTSRKFEGTGLGLSICKHILDMVGGSIRVESQYGKGSTFVFTLPLDRKKENDKK